MHFRLFTTELSKENSFMNEICEMVAVLVEERRNGGGFVDILLILLNT